jgi:hypothetical protein
MKYKNIYLGIMAMLVTACGKDFLDVPLKTDITSEVYFTKESDFTLAINAVYAPLRNIYQGTSSVSEGCTGAFVWDEMRSDNARYIVNPSFRATLNQENTADFITEASNSIALAQFRTNYLMIARANQILYTIDAVTFTSEATKNNVKGQALFLRAFAYFNLVTHFGSVPMHLTPVTNMEETALPLSTSEDVTTQIIADVTEAIDLLPLKSAQEEGRITRGAAKMLLANVYMVEKEWALAETLLKEIVADGQNTLLTDYAAVFDPANKNNAESIFEVQFLAGGDGYASFFTYSFVPYPLSKDTVAKLTGATNANGLAGGEGYNIPSPDLISAYEPGDLRFAATIDSVHDINNVRFPYCKKYLHPHSQHLQANDNWPVYRYAEVLLFLAEALNEQGKTAEALTYINDPVGASPVSIRERAGLPDVVAADQSSARTAIAQERRIELAFENKRLPDLIRTGTVQAVISAYGARVIADPAKYYFPAGYEPSDQAFVNIDELWPLPAEEALYSPYF